MNPANNSSWFRLVVLFSICLVLVCALTLIRAIQASQSTGVLHVVASDSSALLSVSQNNKDAAVIGHGSSTVHLKPGTYVVCATSGSKQATSVVVITKRRTTESKLKVTDLAKVNSADSIEFKDFGKLVDAGLTATQVTATKQSFYLFKKTAHTITIDANSVQPGPHNPRSDDPFIINFKVSVDSDNYNGSISYNDLENVRLYLYSSFDNSLVYDSAANSAE